MLRSLGEVAVTEATASPYAGRGVPATARVPPSLGGPTKVGCEDPCAMVHPPEPLAVRILRAHPFCLFHLWTS